MKGFDKPVVVVSRCIEFDSCRYNGLMITSDMVRRLVQHVDFRPVCPEVEIGLGVPRDPIRVVKMDGNLRLVQPATDRDVTEKMERFARSFLDNLGEVDGFILKGRSPSCGIKDVKAYSGSSKRMSVSRARGLFADAVMRRFPDSAIEEEGRLTNFRIREHFLTKLFALARFRQVRLGKSMKELVRFQTVNKYLLMAYSQKELRALGKVVANQERKPVEQVLRDYQKNLSNALAKAPRDVSYINVLMHLMGHFSERLSPHERSFFLNTLEEYRDERVPLSVPLGILKSWAIRFEDDYLSRQTLVQPFPEELTDVSDSGKGRRI
jgi:uncharacterized protein YbgA (DUF1722 family)/uncharacterized protein YbbK (DUF523 family)